MLALAAMSPTVQAIFYAVAILCFVFAAVGFSTRVALEPLGLAFFAFVFFWTALAAS